MGAKRDYYEVLGVNRDSDEGAIKKAYRKLAKKYHPDTNAGNPQAEEMFKEVTEAYNVLSDSEKKKLYDKFGHGAFDGSGGFSEYGNDSTNAGGRGFYQYHGPGGSYQEYHFEGGDMDDILKGMFSGGFKQHGFSGFGDFHDFGSFAEDGADLQAEVSVGFEEAAFGCDKILNLSQPGKGGATQSLKVHIPAGIDDGKTIRLQGKGMSGSGGGKPGDLLLKVKVGSRPGFERKGMDVYTTIQVPFTTAVLGGEAVVQTLYGNVVCKIAPGTQSGSKIRLRGKGIVSMKNDKLYGDQYVTVQIQVPKNLSENAKEKLREFEKACGVRGRHVA